VQKELVMMALLLVTKLQPPLEEVDFNSNSLISPAKRLLGNFTLVDAVFSYIYVVTIHDHKYKAVMS
jgi:hypothetical protein